ncbi:hypothetical protein [Nocardia heshunensis]
MLIDDRYRPCIDNPGNGRLVVPGDAKGGRYVNNLVDLRVVDLGAAQPK